MPELLRERVSWELRDGVARICLVRGSGNALDLAMAQAFREAAELVVKGAEDGSVRAALLTAEGSTFCVGGDLREFAAAADRGATVRTIAHEAHHGVLALSGAPVPVVSVIQGTVAGGGIGLALAADIVLMAEEAALRLAYTAAGLSPDCGATWHLARRVGSARALDLALTNRVLTGAEAAAIGLVSRAVPSAELTSTAEALVAKLGSGPTDAYAQTKRLLAAAPDRQLADQLDDEAATIGTLIAAPNGVEGVDAFLAKRTPSFH